MIEYRAGMQHIFKSKNLKKSLVWLPLVGIFNI